MRPTLAAQALRDTTVEYLTTTFALAEPDTQEALTDFLTDPADGLFRGPYHRIRRPFRRPGRLAAAPRLAQGRFLAVRAPGRGLRAPDHQGRARPAAHPGHHRHRLRQDRVLPRPDHRPLPARQGGRQARDQGRAALPDERPGRRPADRIGKVLTDERLADVTAGLYIGEASSTKNGSPYGRVAVDRAEIRRNPPDILITNYKMLDLLLQRQQDAPLWADADLAYIVIDEFHTYDGAQAPTSPCCCGGSARSWEPPRRAVRSARSVRWRLRRPWRVARTRPAGPGRCGRFPGHARRGLAGVRRTVP